MAAAQKENRSGQQARDINARETAAGASVPHESAALHVSGDATYVDDIAELEELSTLRSARAVKRMRACVRSILMR